MNVTDLKRFLEERSEDVPHAADIRAGALKRAKAIQARRLSAVGGVLVGVLAVASYALNPPNPTPEARPAPSSSPLMHGFPQHDGGAERIALYHFNFADKSITFEVPATPKGFWLNVGCVPHDSSVYLNFDMKIGEQTVSIGMSCLATSFRYRGREPAVGPVRVTISTAGAQKIGTGRGDFTAPPREIPFPSGTMTIAVMAVQ